MPTPTEKDKRPIGVTRYFVPRFLVLVCEIHVTGEDGDEEVVLPSLPVGEGR